jgi:hypothetical protein
VFAGEGSFEKLYDRMARPVAGHDGHGLLGTVEAVQWLAGASTRATAAATCAANCGPVNRAHSAHSPTLKGRLGPKSTVFSAFRLDSARCKLAFTSSERRFHAF